MCVTGHFSTEVPSQPVAHSAGCGRPGGGGSPLKRHFSSTVRSNAPDLLSDVVWLIQTKTNAPEFKNRVKRLNICT